MNHHTLALLVAVAIGCAPFVAICCSPVPGPDPIPEPDPTPRDDACQRAEDVLCRLDCRDAFGDPLCQGPTGLSFGARCRDEVRRGVPWDVECLSTITECSQVDAATTGDLCAAGTP